MGIAIAIDGPSASGKSTIAKAVAARLGYVHIDTGAMYRAVALYMRQTGGNWDDEAAVLAAMENVDIALDYTQEGQRIFLGGEDVTEAVRTAEMGIGASRVSQYPHVRERLVGLQRSLAKSHDVIMDGRDIGTVVLPEAPVKVFLTATLEARVRRRCFELDTLGHDYDYDEIAAQIEKRDFDDSNRAAAPLAAAADAVVMDTSDMDIDEVVEEILRLINEKVVRDV